MTDSQEKLDRAQWVEDLSRNRFAREWLGDLNPDTGKFEGGTFLQTLRDAAADTPDDNDALIVRKMIKVHTAYMNLLAQYLSDGKVERATIAQIVAEQERAA